MYQMLIDETPQDILYHSSLFIEDIRDLPINPNGTKADIPSFGLLILSNTEHLRYVSFCDIWSCLNNVLQMKLKIRIFPLCDYSVICCTCPSSDSIVKKKKKKSIQQISKFNDHITMPH